MRACAQDHGMDIYEFGEYIKDHPGVAIAYKRSNIITNIAILMGIFPPING